MAHNEDFESHPEEWESHDDWGNPNGDGSEPHENPVPETEAVVSESGDSSTELEQFTPADNVDLETVAPMSREEAIIITEHIRATADVLYVLIQRAHAGKAWVALGYNSFGEYVNAEFNISRSRAYQLLNQASVIEQIEAVAPEGTRISINEATARDLKSMVNELVPEIAEATEGLDGEEAQSIIDDLVAQFRAEAKEAAEGEGNDEFADFAGGEPPADPFGFEGEFNGSDSGGGSSDGPRGPGDYFEGSGEGHESDNSDEGSEFEFSDFDDLFGTDEDPHETRKRLEDVYNVYNALAALKNMRDPAEMVELIPHERRIQITASLPAALEWLTNFNDQWHRQPWVNEYVAQEDEGNTQDAEDGDDDIFGDLN